MYVPILQEQNTDAQYCDWNMLDLYLGLSAVNLDAKAKPVNCLPVSVS